ncbi:hypothetical protein D7D52_07555 [Nocardia yunnanensis]|uniref:Carboxylesterase type B domain-containing protein n=2 Tax=Nocardia yunnanensis TaxID=2382165 RepID=A0A386Z7Y5_9NOCA|nr:carboxylesterase family protein [Nocardia yunnanensis]AYF73738.1 hypothetical protein D7D52_07555 [Nocardia yunnanensis]
MHQGDDPTVQTTAGPVHGRWKHHVAAFLGIPYAAAPFGALRFRPPKPAQPWPGVRDASTFGPPVPQASHRGAVMTAIRRRVRVGVGATMPSASLGETWATVMPDTVECDDRLIQSRYTNWYIGGVCWASPDCLPDLRSTLAGLPGGTMKRLHMMFAGVLAGAAVSLPGVVSAGAAAPVAAQCHEGDRVPTDDPRTYDSCIHDEWGNLRQCPPFTVVTQAPDGDVRCVPA